MFKRDVHGRLLSGAALPALLCALLAASFSTPAQARHRHHVRHAAHNNHVRFHARQASRHMNAARHVHGEHVHAAGAGAGATAAIVIDGATGRVIYGMNENAPRHPASVTKVMTLYLLFEQMEKGKLSLDSEIPVSAHAAAQAPSKLGLRPGQTIRVEDAIKVIVTKSANDIAVAVAESIGGTESDFAELMTRKAHALGMSHTTYVNASGLPNNEQITTAADLALLGRSIQERFPRYYHYFSLHEFAFRGQHIHNHNHLLGRIEGMDGIKTGYTAASGFNLLTSVKRDGHYIVSVVMGGKTAHARDNFMEGLIEEHIAEGGAFHGGTRVAERENESPAREASAARDDRDEDQKAEAPKSESRKVAKEARSSEPVKAEPAPVLPIAAIAPDLHAHPSYVQPSYAAAAAEESRENDARIASAPLPRHGAPDGAMRWNAGPNAVAAYRSAIRFELTKPQSELGKKTAAAKKTGPEPAPEKTESGVSVQPRQMASEKPPISGWMIQIGATDAADKAAALLSRAKGQHGAHLASARAFTETVHKGRETLYRARFAGLEESGAEAACKALKSSGFSCFATKN